MPSSIQLSDGDLLLRPFRFSDATQLYEAVHESLKDLEPWMSWASDRYDEMSAREYITIARARWDEHTFYAFAMTRGERMLGVCTLSSLHPIYHFCNLGYWVRSACRGQGIAGRAARMIGAHEEGILLNRMVIGNTIHDAHMFSLLPADFGLVARL
jgi:RimJ/RimL family protein N-acetyltransferase